MPLTPAVSSQYADYSAKPQKMVRPQDWGAPIKMNFGKLTYTAAGQGTAQVIRMPAGRVRILPDLSRLVSPAGTAGQTIDVGYGAHKDASGTDVVAAPAAFLAAEVNTAALDLALKLPASGELVLESQDGFDITFTVATQNSAAAGDVIVYIAYQIGR